MTVLIIGMAVMMVGIHELHNGDFGELGSLGNCD